MQTLFNKSDAINTSGQVREVPKNNYGNTGSAILNGINGLQKTSQGQTGAERAMGMAQTIASIMALLN